MAAMRRLRGIPDVLWIEDEGRNREGDRNQFSRLIGADGQVMASINLPQAGESTFETYLNAGWVKGFGCAEESRMFIEIAPAKRWCERYAAAYLKAHSAKARKKRRPRAIAEK